MQGVLENNKKPLALQHNWEMNRKSESKIYTITVNVYAMIHLISNKKTSMRHECSFDLKINIMGKGGVKLRLSYSVDKNLNLQPFWRQILKI